MAESKRYYWLKLMSDFFAQPRIKKLRRIAGGDKYTIIYQKLQLLSLNDGARLYYEGIEPTLSEELALTIDEDAENVEVTLKFLLSQGLMEQVSETEYLLTETQRLIGSECYSAERVRRHRQSKALQCNSDVPGCNTPVTACNEEIDIEKEKDIEIEKRESRDRVDYQLIADMYNNTCMSFPSIKSLSDSRKKAIKARLRSYSVGDFQKLFEMAEESDFLKGQNSRNWSATFDWLIKDGNMAKVLDGNYRNRAQSTVGPGGIDWSKV